MKHLRIKPSQGRIIGLLALIWLLGVIGDRLWLRIDQAVPSWDQAEYLSGVLTYWQALQTPDWFNQEWWRQLWLLSPKTPPLTYLLGVPIVDLFGNRADDITWLYSFCNAGLILAVYGLGRILFTPAIALWAVAFSQLMPGLYRYRLEFVLDFPLTTIVTIAFCLLTWWRQFCVARQAGKPVSVTQNWKSWLGAIAFGLALGCALLVKQTALFFLLLPSLWLALVTFWRRDWLGIAQGILALLVSMMIWWPWYRTNWLLILTSGKRATVDSALREGDPTLLSWEAWTYYGKILGILISAPLLLVAIAGVGYWLWQRQGRKSLTDSATPDKPLFSIDNNWRWLILFILGGYLLTSLNINKDSRYILPLLPTCAVVLAAGFSLWPRRWQKYLGLGTLTICLGFMTLNLLPLSTHWTQSMSRYTRHPAYVGPTWPHEAAITAIIDAVPYQRVTLGVLPSTIEINQHNISFLGKRAQGQVLGRQVGVRESEVKQDGRSLDWFLTKTGKQGSVPEAQAAIVNLVKQGGEFKREQTWPLPEAETLELYRRRQPSLEVEAIAPAPAALQLEQVIVPKTAPPGYPIPVIYQWSGPSQALASGLVLLTWQRVPIATGPTLLEANTFWLHDHAIGMGNLWVGASQPSTPQGLRVFERTAMFPGSTIAPGTYQLQASYLDPQTNQQQPLTVPHHARITISSEAPIPPAPELDLATQLRRLAPGLSQGLAGLDPIFQEIGRINQYDLDQDYLRQLDETLSYRFQHQASAQQIDWAYSIILARVLKQDVNGAIAMLEQLKSLDANSPYPYAYQAFVYLYDWRPRAAQQALQPALAQHPHLPELQVLNGAADLLQGRLIRAWRQLSQGLSQLS